MKSIPTLFFTLFSSLLVACGSTSKNGSNLPQNQGITPPPVTPFPDDNTPVPPPSRETLETDETIFNRLSSEHFGSQNWLTLQFAETGVVLSATNKTNVGDHHIQTLRDNDAKLIGYVGYLSGTQTDHDPLRPDDPIVTRNAFVLLGVDEKQRILPSTSLNYEGEMHYFYENQANIYTAGVIANYTTESKQVEMTISGRGADYSRLWTLSTQATQDGKVTGVLIENRQRRGEFDGGFYGNEGQHLVGKTQFEDANHKDESWKGVIQTTVPK